jgi:hypothetical protein
LIFAEHFGNIEVLNSELKVELSMKPDKINTIFQMISLSKRGEFALCAYNGVYFIKLKTEIAKLELVVQSESYLPDKCVQKGVEYATDKLIVCV